jgi:hypothetical protein
MAALVTNNMTVAGTKPTFASAAASDTAECGPGMFAVYRNGSGSPVTVTVLLDHLTLSSGDVYPDKEYSVAATTGEAWIPLLGEYVEAAGRVTLTTSAQTSVTVAVVRCWK